MNNNSGSFQDLILLLKIFMNILKDLLKIYRQFGHAASKIFASPRIVGYAQILWTDHYKGLRKMKWLIYYVTNH